MSEGEFLLENDFAEFEKECRRNAVLTVCESEWGEAGALSSLVEKMRGGRGTVLWRKRCFGVKTWRRQAG